MDQAIERIRTTEQPLSKAAARLAVNLAFASRVLSINGHDDLNQGQVSARMPGCETFLIKRAVAGFNEATPEDMIRAHVDPRQPVDPKAPPELPLHQAIYGRRQDVNAIVHSHSPYALVFGATDLALLPVSHDGACFQGRIHRFTGTSHTVLTLDTGLEVAEALGDGAAVLMRNHGALIAARTLREAAVLGLVLERACRIQLMAEGVGVPYHVSDIRDVRRKQAYIYEESSMRFFWDYCVRAVKERWPESRNWNS